jgi:ABC-type uncharacterized transport system permease subunit
MGNAALLPLIGYAEAALAYAGDYIHPGRLARLAIWGVRLGWLAQTAILIAQAAGADGFPWGSWAGSLNLFVWITVGVYLIWGCRAPFRLVGLAVMPLAAGLFALAWARGGAGAATRESFDAAFLAAHVGLVLLGFAGFTVAAALAVVYLWQDRRLKRHAPGLLRVRAPSLSALDVIAARTVAVALAALTLGSGIGFARLGAEGGRLDPVIVATLVAWLVYAAYLVLRYEAGWRGRRAAYVVLAGFTLVLCVRLGSTVVGHF